MDSPKGADLQALTEPHCSVQQVLEEHLRHLKLQLGQAFEGREAQLREALGNARRENTDLCAVLGFTPDAAHGHSLRESAEKATSSEWLALPERRICLPQSRPVAGVAGPHCEQHEQRELAGPGSPASRCSVWSQVVFEGATPPIVYECPPAMEFAAAVQKIPRQRTRDLPLTASQRLARMGSLQSTRSIIDGVPQREPGLLSPSALSRQGSRSMGQRTRLRLNTSTICSCGHARPADPDAVFCNACGLVLAPLWRCPCGSSQASDTQFCSRCGRMVHDAGAEASTTSFSLLPGWRQEMKLTSKPSQLPRISQTAHRIHVKAEQENSPNARKLPLRPTGSVRVFWDLMICSLLMYEALWLPLALLDFHTTQPQEVLDWVGRCIWTLDIPLAFCTGFSLPDASLELRWGKIARRYMCQLDGLILDTVVVASDWVLAIMSTGYFGAARTVRVLKAMHALKVLKTLRAFRMVRLTHLSHKYLPAIQYFARSVSATVILGLARVLVMLLIALHFLTCCWFGIGISSRDAGMDCWLYSVDYMESPTQTETYLVAFHWALTQFIGSMDVDPRNLGERVYAIGALLLAFIVMSVVPPTITTLMTTFQSAAAENKEPMRQLTDYLHDNGISHDLGVRVQRAGVNALRVQRKKLPESKVALLPFLSIDLQTELKYEIFSPLLLKHPLFWHLNEAFQETFICVCHEAVSSFMVPTQEHVFLSGEESIDAAMLFVRSGRMRYTTEQGDVSMLFPGHWVCEAELWTQWVHCGSFTALEDSVLVRVDTARFQDVLQRGLQSLDGTPRRYAEKFVTALNELGVEEALDFLEKEDLDVDAIAAEVFPRKDSIFERRSSWTALFTHRGDE